MSQRGNKNIDLLTKVKKFFSPKSKSRKQKEDSGFNSTSSGSSLSVEIMDPDQPVKPRRKGGKSKSMGEIPRSAESEVIDVESDNLAPVHRQPPVPTVRNSLGEAGSSAGMRRYKAVSHLAELAQLTIQNERLSKENQALRHHKSTGLLGGAGSQGDGEVEPRRGPPIRYNPGGETVESLLLDRELLENLVWRLNVELGRYETRLQQTEKSSHSNRISADNPAPAWCRADPATLAPLLHAYDEALLEKSHLIETFEHKLQELGAELREVVSENERLHEALDEVLNKESEAREENSMLQHDVDTLHSENVILLEKLETEKAKYEELSEEYGSNKVQVEEQEVLIAQKQAELKTLAREYGILENQLAEAKIEIEQRISAKHHNDAIEDCRQLLEQLKASYKEDRRVLEERNKALLVEKVAAEAEIRNLSSECAQSEARVKAQEKLLRRTEARSEQTQARLVHAESCRDSSVRELRQLMVVAERLTADQEALLQQLQAHQGTNRRLFVLRSSLKSVQKELPEIERQLRDQENGVERMKGDHHREIVRLKTLLRHKDQAIKLLQSERNSTCDQLEMARRAAGFESLNTAEREPLSLPAETHCSKSPP